MNNVVPAITINEDVFTRRYSAFCYRLHVYRKIPLVKPSSYKLLR